MKKKHIIFSIIFCIITTSSAGFYYLKKTSSTVVQENKISLYTIDTQDKIFINGIITPEKSESINFDPSKGSINKVSVQNGQIVKKGDTLFTYKNDDVTAQISQISLQISINDKQKRTLLAKQDELKKQIKDPKNDTITASAMSSNIQIESNTYKDQSETLQDQISSLQNQLDSLKQKENIKITSPIDGKVTINDISGNTATPYIVIESTTFYVKGNINEKDQIKLKKDQAAEILILSTNKIASGKVTSVDDRPINSDMTSKTISTSESNISYYGVNLSFDSQENLTNGFHVQATLNLSDNIIKIPKKSVLDQDGKKYIFKAINKKLVKQEVTITEISSTDVIANTGLKIGDTIVTNPTLDTKEGNPVE
jgi:HlyD family secretion protein